jgi:hypothetical protein
MFVTAVRFGGCGLESWYQTVRAFASVCSVTGSLAPLFLLGERIQLVIRGGFHCFFTLGRGYRTAHRNLFEKGAKPNQP